MNDKVRRAIRGTNNHEKWSKDIQKMIQEQEKCGLGVEKYEVEKKRGFFAPKSHASVRESCKSRAARPYTDPSQLPLRALDITL